MPSSSASAVAIGVNAFDLGVSLAAIGANAFQANPIAQAVSRGPAAQLLWRPSQ